MWVRDFSKKEGGRTKKHGTHQTGLNVDMRLPLKNLLTYDHSYSLHGGEKDPNYHMFDREASRLQLKAIKAQMNIKRVLFNDKQLIKERLCQQYTNHGGHYHIIIKPPKRVEGIYK